MSDEPSDKTQVPPAEAVEVVADAGDVAVSDGETVEAGELAALREKAAQAEAMKERYLRAVADLENFRKRSVRDRQEAVQFANQGLMEKLVPALDNLDMALAAVSSASGDASEAMKTGVQMVLGQLRAVLRESGLEEIDATGQAFDPSWHEAVSETVTADVPEGHVAQQLRKGYRLHQRLLRPASVIVARAPQG